MTDHDVDPDCLRNEAITMPQRDVDRELQRGPYPVRYGQPPATRPPLRGPVKSVSHADPTPPLSSASPLPPGYGRPTGQDAADGVRPPAGQTAGNPARILFTPAQAADLLQVRESWLRRRAAGRLVPCTFLGKHLRFSRANLEQIAADAARPATTTQPTSRGTGAHPSYPGRPRGQARTNSRRSDTGRRTRFSRT